jgi:hypothetical protein
VCRNADGPVQREFSARFLHRSLYEREATRVRACSFAPISPRPAPAIPRVFASATPPCHASQGSAPPLPHEHQSHARARRVRLLAASVSRLSSPNHQTFAFPLFEAHAHHAGCLTSVAPFDQAGAAAHVQQMATTMSANLLDFEYFPGAPADKFKLAKLASLEEPKRPPPARPEVVHICTHNAKASEAQPLPPPPPLPACANPRRRDASAIEDPRPEIVHIYGLNPNIKFKDVMSYLTAKGLAPPLTVAWVNDSSANVVFSDASSAAAALEQLTVPLLPNAQGIDTTSWRTLPIVEKGRQVLFRLATASDFQPPRSGVCWHWANLGKCRHGRACKFAHDETDRISRRGSARVGPPRWSSRSASPSSASPSSASPSSASPQSASPVSGAQPGADRPRPTMSPELLAAAVANLAVETEGSS